MLKEITKSLDKILIVSDLPLFHNLSIGEKVFIANRSQIIEYNKNDIIYDQGQKKDFLHIVLGGRICLFHPGGKGDLPRKQKIEILRKNDYFGIISLLTGKPHSVSAEVINDARILRIPHESFKQILDKIPRLAVHFSRTLSRRLKKEYTKPKTIFQSTILSIYYNGDEQYSSRYAKTLGMSIAKESGKKVIVLALNKRISGETAGGADLKTIRTHKKEIVISLLSNLTCEYHFVILDLPKDLGIIEKAALRQDDVCHILSEPDINAAKNIAGFIEQFGTQKREIKIIVKEYQNHNRDVAESFENILHQKIYATLSYDPKEYKKALRRIARETSGVLIGLALGSGGALGLAQIGVLQILERENIPIDIVAGTSIGALIAAFWAAGLNGKEIEKIAMGFHSVSRTLGLIDLTLPTRGGFVSGRNVKRFLEKYLAQKTFYDIKRTLRIVACDIETRQEVVISSGKLVDAVMASVAIPGVLNPYTTKDGRLLVDGGIVSPVPIGALSKEGVKTIIAVNSIPAPVNIVKGATKKQTIVDIIVNSFYSMEYKIAQYACKEADIYLHASLEDAAWYEFYRAKEFVQFGRKKASKIVPELKKLTKQSI